MVDLEGYLILVVENRDGNIKVYGKKIFCKAHVCCDFSVVRCTGTKRFFSLLSQWEFSLLSNVPVHHRSNIQIVRVYHKGSKWEELFLEQNLYLGKKEVPFIEDEIQILLIVSFAVCQKGGEWQYNSFFGLIYNCHFTLTCKSLLELLSRYLFHQ